MACVKPDGTLTEMGRQGLEALAVHGGEEAAAKASGLPLYRVRMLSRALIEEGLLEEREGRLAPTALGREKLKGP
ncbi:MAG: hypothetical protein ACOZEN_07945 [Thermodesulfobacteriota bacterium]